MEKGLFVLKEVLNKTFEMLIRTFVIAFFHSSSLNNLFKNKRFALSKTFVTAKVAKITRRTLGEKHGLGINRLDED